MRALLLAAGIGSRLAPLTEALPKCLAPINGVPLLAYWLDALTACGIERFLINTHHLADAVADYVRRSPWADCVDLVHEAELRGTGGTLRANRGWWQDDGLVLVHADNLCHCDFAAFIAAHRQRPADILATMMTFDTPDPQSCGIVLTGPDHRLTAFHEKEADLPGCRASAAVFILAPEFAALLDTFDACTAIDFSRDLIPQHLTRFQAWHNAQFHSDIGTPAAFLQAQLDFVWPAPEQAPAAAVSAPVLAGLTAIAGSEWTIRREVPPGFSAAATFRQSGKRILAASTGKTE
ncbi:MAG: nucleotidyltransferase family protein [Betaproteobacteria bacterium]|uniref:Nucleotidyltransferase family protein n=1 Tax=Candidatus Proximibacter danicus TaxID=2954365 RepID=A0A9D7K1K7_9PROT|nr:nucleotidyltransferase family protein [Candidatus Proximibacter danicus]